MFMDFNKHWLSSGLSTFNTRAEILTWIGLIQGLKDQRLYFSLCLNVLGEDKEECYSQPLEWAILTRFPQIE